MCPLTPLTGFLLHYVCMYITIRMGKYYICVVTYESEILCCPLKATTLTITLSPSFKTATEAFILYRLR